MEHMQNRFAAIYAKDIASYEADQIIEYSFSDIEEAYQAGAQSHWRPISEASVGVPAIFYCAGKQNYNSGIVVGVLDSYLHGVFVRLEASDCQTGCGDTDNPTHFMYLPPIPTEEV